MSKLSLPFALLVTIVSAGAAAFENPRQAPGYLHGTWSTVHTDSSNSDHVPLSMTPNLRQKWHLLKGAGIWTPPAVNEDGTIYAVTGLGRGHSHLHAIAPSGEILWQSAPQESDSDLDSLAVVSAPVLDDSGDVYLGDSNQLWAFHRDGDVKWVTELRPLGVNEPFVTGIIVNDYVGGVSLDGKVVLLRRDTGELAVPVLALPGTTSPLGPEIPDALWKDLIDPAIRDQAWEILRGYRYEISNTPAVHPKTGRIFVIGAGQNEDVGHFYGIDIVQNRLKLSFITQVPAGSGTSPGISPDGKRLYAMAKGHLFAIDTDIGVQLWSKDVNGQDASPTVGPDDTVYVLGGQRLVAVEGRTGNIRWERDYNDFVQEQLPEIWTRFGLVEQGAPVGFIDSVASVTPDLMWSTVLGGYSMNLFGRKFHHAARTWLLAIRPSDGMLIAHYPLPDTSEGGITVGPMGQLYMDMLAAQASIARHAGYQWILPREVQMSEPVGGLIAFEQANLKDHCKAGLRWAGRVLRGEGGESVEPGLETARAASQLSISARCVRSIEPASASHTSTAETLEALAGAVRACDAQGCDRERLAAEVTRVLESIR